MVVAEASAAGVPVVVCEHPDNAAVELVEDGVNGAVAADPSAAALADALLRVLEEGSELRLSTAAWFERNAGRLSAATSIDRLRELYAGRDGPWA
jgi:glycosyltransferase involved in cell wall biosynthesis